MVPGDAAAWSGTAGNHKATSGSSCCNALRYVPMREQGQLPEGKVAAIHTCTAAGAVTRCASCRRASKGTSLGVTIVGCWRWRGGVAARRRSGTESEGCDHEGIRVAILVKS
jgi:hypothetical protein